MLCRTLVYVDLVSSSLVSGTPGLATTPAGDYSINQEQLASITRDHDFSALEEFGGASLLAAHLLVFSLRFLLF